ncbi:hypothetical protein H5410_036991, partial [Solanum commersonii]
GIELLFLLERHCTNNKWMFLEFEITIKVWLLQILLIVLKLKFKVENQGDISAPRLVDLVAEEENASPPPFNSKLRLVSVISWERNSLIRMRKTLCCIYAYIKKTHGCEHSLDGKMNEDFVSRHLSM